MVVRDRLKELQEASKYCKEGEEVQLQLLLLLIKLQVEMKPLKGGQDFSSFLEVAEEINAGIDQVKKNVDEMKITQKRILQEPSKAEREKYQAKHSDSVEVRPDKYKVSRFHRLVLLNHPLYPRPTKS